MTEYPENVVSRAIAAFETDVNQAKSLSNYVLITEGEYAESNFGRAELLQLIRVAQYITLNRGDNFTDPVKYFYYGELLGNQLVNYLQPSEELKGGFAQAYLGERIREQVREQTRVEVANEYDRVPLKRTTPSENQNKLARTIQDELTSVNEHEQIPEVYDKLAQKLARSIGDNIELQHFLLMGFRLVVKHALAPKFELSTPEVFDAVEDMTNGSVVLAETPDAEPEEQTEAQKVDALLNTFEVSQPDYYWEDTGPVTEDIMEYISVDIDGQKDLLYNADPAISHAARMFINARLRAFNRAHGFMKDGDILRVEGDFYGVLEDVEGRDGLLAFTLDSESRGEFDGIHLVKVPTPDDLIDKLYPDESTNPEPTSEPDAQIFSPAIRIKNPTFIDRTTPPGKNDRQYMPEVFLSIPLVYTDFYILKLTETQPE